MNPATTPLTFHRGAKWSQTITFYQSGTETPTEPGRSDIVFQDGAFVFVPPPETEPQPEPVVPIEE